MRVALKIIVGVSGCLVAEEFKSGMRPKKFKE
jgi:hypothetical protein